MLAAGAPCGPRCRGLLLPVRRGPSWGFTAVPQPRAGSPPPHRSTWRFPGSSKSGLCPSSNLLHTPAQATSPERRFRPVQSCSLGRPLLAGDPSAANVRLRPRGPPAVSPASVRPHSCAGPQFCLPRGPRLCPPSPLQIPARPAL